MRHNDMRRSVVGPILAAKGQLFMAHVLVYYPDRAIRQLVSEMCEIEGHNVTRVDTLDDALMVLRASLHRIVAILDWDHDWQHPYRDFFALRDANPDWYAQHGYIGLRWRPLTEEDEAVLAADGVRIFRGPFMAEDLLRAVAELAAGSS